MRLRLRRWMLAVALIALVLAWLPRHLYVQRRGLHRGVWIHCQDSRGYPYVVAAWIWHYPGVRGSVLLVGEDSRCYVLASWHRDQGWMFRYDARRPRPGNVLSPPL